MEYIQADIWVRFQRMQGHEVHFVVRRRRARRADHAQGREGGHHAAGARARGSPPAARSTSTASTSASTTGTRPTRRRTSSCRRTSTARCKAAGLIYAQADRAVLRPGQGHVPAGPLHQGRVPELPRQGPVRRRLRGLRHGLRADRPDQPVLDADRREAGAEDLRALLLPAVRPALRRLPAATGSNTPGRLQPQVVNKAQRMARPAKAIRRSATGTSRATRPTSASRSRTRRASTSTSGWMRRSATSPRCKNYFDSGKARANGEPRSFEEFLAASDTRADPLHRQGHHLLPHAVLAGDAAVRRPHKVPDHVYVHGFITVTGEKMSKSRGTGISPLRYLELGMNPEWLRYYIAAKLNANVEDLDFNPDDFVARVNSDLVGKYVNIASRAANFITRHFDGAARRTAATIDAAARARPHAIAQRVARAATRRASSARRCARSWRSPTASTRTSTRASRGCWPRTRRSARRAAGRLLARAARLQAADACCWRRCCRSSRRASRGSCSGSTGRFTWSDAARAAAARRRLSAPDDTRRPEAARCAVRDGCGSAEPPAPPAEPQRASRREAGAQPRRRAPSPRDDHRIDDFTQARPARRADRRRRARRGRRQAAEAHARRRRAGTRTVFAGIKSAYDPATLVGPAHRRWSPTSRRAR